MRIGEMNFPPRSRTARAALAATTTFAVVGILVWQLDSGSRGDQATPPRPASTTSVGMPARIVTVDTLRRVALALGRPVYWAGERLPARLEYTQASDGSTYVRYLTGSARAGTSGSTYVVIATYAQPNALARVRATARRQHYRVEHVPGAVAVTDPKSPRNIHLAFDHQPYQVEVYAPTPQQAREIVRSGVLGPVG